jgi:hypothetical protein
MKGKQTYVRLICDRERLLPEQARFTVLKDMKGLGNVVSLLSLYRIYFSLIVSGSYKLIETLSNPLLEPTSTEQ